MSPCCGQPSRRRKRAEPLAIPDNPTVRDAVRLLYLGGDYAELSGSASGLRYHTAPHRRDFAVERGDERALLRRRDVILAPGEKLRG